MLGCLPEMLFTWDVVYLRCCLPEMVEVAALHMWNQKYGPQVIWDWTQQTNCCSIEQCLHTYSHTCTHLLNLSLAHTHTCTLIMHSQAQLLNPSHTHTHTHWVTHPYSIYRFQQIFLLWLLLFPLFVIGAVLLHGLSTGEVNYPARRLLLLLSISPLQVPQLHTLKVLTCVWALGQTNRLLIIIIKELQAVIRACSSLACSSLALSHSD